MMNAWMNAPGAPRSLQGLHPDKKKMAASELKMTADAASTMNAADDFLSGRIADVHLSERREVREEAVPMSSDRAVHGGKAFQMLAHLANEGNLSHAFTSGYRSPNTLYPHSASVVRGPDHSVMNPVCVSSEGFWDSSFRHQETHR